jgi:hypothetical protein
MNLSSRELQPTLQRFDSVNFERLEVFARFQCYFISLVINIYLHLSAILVLCYVAAMV